LIGLAGAWGVVALMPSSLPAPFAAIKPCSKPLFGREVTVCRGPSVVSGHRSDDVFPAVSTR
jgi:hypothetical protein